MKNECYDWSSKFINFWDLITKYTFFVSELANSMFPWNGKNTKNASVKIRKLSLRVENLFS